MPIVPNTNKLILLNGPRRVGKDSIAKELEKVFSSVIMHFAEPVKAGTHASFGLPHPSDYYEAVKDEPNSDFFGFTPRQAWINHAEGYMRKLYGQDVYVKILCNKLKTHMVGARRFVIVPDCRFSEEVYGMTSLFDMKDMLLVNVLREGYSFENDTGEYLNYEWLRRVVISNKENQLDLAVKTLYVHILDWLGMPVKV